MTRKRPREPQLPGHIRMTSYFNMNVAASILAALLITIPTGRAFFVPLHRQTLSFRHNNDSHNHMNINSHCEMTRSPRFVCSDRKYIGSRSRTTTSTVGLGPIDFSEQSRRRERTVSPLYGMFSNRGKSKNKGGNDGEEDSEGYTVNTNLSSNATSSLTDELGADNNMTEGLDKASKEDDILEEIMSATKAVDDVIIPANANVVGITSFGSKDTPMSEEPTVAPLTTDTRKNTQEKKKKKKRKRRMLTKIFRHKRASKLTEVNQDSVSLEDAIENDKKIINQGKNNVDDKIIVIKSEQTKSTSPENRKKKRRFLPKRFTTYATLALFLLLAAPVPKRFSAFLEDDASPGQRYSFSPRSLSPSYRAQNDEWWKQQRQQTNKDQDDFSTSTPSQAQEEDSTSRPEEKALASRPLLQERLDSPQQSSPVPTSTSFVASAVKKIGPSVVRIDTEIYASASTEDFVNPFTFPGDGDNDQSEEELVRSGQGSGIIFSNNHGLVLTNAHVVDGANRVYVTLTDGRKFVAEVRGVDDMVDLAVLKILEHAPWGGHSPWGSPGNGSNGLEKDNSKKSTDGDKLTEWKGEPLPVGTLGDSNKVEVGEFVIAVGNPGGLDNTVTMGIVSSLKRSSEEIGLPSKKVTFIQTDAAVNPGNSGGPLVNEHGEIIGINTCIRANMEGIAFAIPINKAKEIMFELAQGKNIQHGYIGVVMMTITPDFARQNNLDPNSPVGMIPEVNGVMIERVLGNTPAAVEGGLRRLDVVLEIGGMSVKNANEAASLVDAATVGRDLEVKILRGGREMSVAVKPGDLAEKLRLKKKMMKSQQERAGPFGGGGGGNGGGGGRIYVLPFPTP